MTNAGRLALVFIHGAGANSDFWHWQQSAFPGAHYLNLPGHYKGSGARGQGPGTKDTASNPKSKIQNPKSIAAHADWVAQYVEDEALESVVLNGHSMGGAITMTLALRQPAWLKAIILTGTGARLRVLPRLLDLLLSDYPAAVDLIIQDSFAPPSGQLTYAQRARLNGTKRQILRTPQEVTRGDYQACDGFDVMERVGEITVPTLCIVGARDRMTPPRYSQYLHSKIAGSRLEVIDGAGHMLPMEQPEEYNRRVAAFVGGLA